MGDLDSADAIYYAFSDTFLDTNSIEGKTVSADFLLDTTPFGMVNTGVNKDVRIRFSIQP